MGTVLAVEQQDDAPAQLPVDAATSGASSLQQADGFLTSASIVSSSSSTDGELNPRSANSAKRYAAGGAVDVVALLQSHHVISARAH